MPIGIQTHLEHMIMGKLRPVKSPEVIAEYVDRLRCSIAITNNTSSLYVVSSLVSDSQWETALPFEFEPYSGYGAIAYASEQIDVQFELSPTDSDKPLARVSMIMDKDCIRSFLVETLSKKVQLTSARGGDADTTYVFAIIIDRPARY
jgi:hypothetical protein